MTPLLAIEIETSLSLLIENLCPRATGRPMYGGKMYEISTGNPKTAFCGVFCYKAHVSLEFTHGARLSDPGRNLEGRGKLRRHIKFRTPEEINTKSAATYIQQAYELMA